MVSTGASTSEDRKNGVSSVKCIRIVPLAAPLCAYLGINGAWSDGRKYSRLTSGATEISASMSNSMENEFVQVRMEETRRIVGKSHKPTGSL